MRILWAIFGIKMYALWYLHPSAKTKKTKAAALPMDSVRNLYLTLENGCTREEGIIWPNLNHS